MSKTILSDQRSFNFDLIRMIVAGIRHNWRLSLSVALGVATATAVIVGALLVGDSMRGSLRGLTIERLGKTESVIIPGAFFDADGIVPNTETAPIPLILFSSGVVESTRDFDASGDGSIKRAGSVQIIGCDQDFWRLDTTGVQPTRFPDDNGVVLNESTAAEIGVQVGDLITLRLPVQQAVPADSPLGRRDIQTEGLPRMEVIDIIPDRGLGRFALSPSQASPQNAFVSRATIGDVLQRPGQANALLFDVDVSIDDLNIDLADLGLSLKRVTRKFQSATTAKPETIFDYYSLTSDRLLLPEAAIQAITETLPAKTVTPVSTYLANAIERVGEDGKPVATVSYSTVSAIDSSDALPLSYDQPTDSEAVPLVINDWAAEQLDASVGSKLRIAYYEPEVENGREIERYFDAVVTQIVPITKPAKRYFRSRDAVYDQPPTVYNDPDLTPSVPGVTDQDSISDWDLPFKLKREITSADDTYWNEHRLTPKAFLPLADGQRMFGSRFGKTTGLRIETSAAPDMATLRATIIQSLAPLRDDLGWQVRHLKQQQLQASKGTTPFDALFLSLSFFVIFSAVMLIAMLFRLGLIQRMRQFGTLMAIGWTPHRVMKLAIGEGLLVALLGILLGMAGGVVYAMVVLWALKTMWVGAVTVPFLDFHWTLQSLLIGGLAGWIVAALALWTTTRSLVKVRATTLLSGRDTDLPQPRGEAFGSGRAQASRSFRNGDRPEGSRPTAKSAQIAVKKWAVQRRLPMIAGVTALFAVIAAGVGASLGGQAAAGGFVGGGMLLLIATLLAVYAKLHQPRRIGEINQQGAKFSLGSLAARNASRHPLRSTLTIGLMATAVFLIIAITAFQLQPTDQGTGGYNLIANSAQPIYRDLNAPDVQSNTLGPDAESFHDAVVASLRLRPGQDASCNNLYRASQPTVIGVPRGFAAPTGSTPRFQWASVADGQPSGWSLLDQRAAGTQSDPIPVALDQNTAMWSLQMMGGVGEVRSFEYETDKPVYFRVVGLLANSILQGRLIIGEENFQTIFPDVSGYQFFMIDCPTDVAPEVASSLENRLGDIGMDVSESKTVLAGMLAVQNTYLRTFQSLGALGLLLGTIGLAVSQLRSVLERRRELAVMRAVGFTRRRLAMVVMSETASLLLLGIGCGAVCAFLAVLPHALLAGLTPPIIEPIVIVAGIIIFGMFAGLMAVRQVLKIPLIDALRPE